MSIPYSNVNEAVVDDKTFKSNTLGYTAAPHSKFISLSFKAKSSEMAGENTTPKFPEPTAKEAMFFYHIIISNKGKLEVDWNQVAEKSGYSNGATASVRFGQIKKRLGLTNDGSAPAAKSTPAKVRAKKDIGSGTNATPSKVTKKRTPKKSSKLTDAELFGMVADDDEMLKGEQDTKDEVTGHGYGEEEIRYYDDEDDCYDESGAKNVHDDGSFV